MRYELLKKRLEKSPLKIEEIADNIGVTAEELMDKLEGRAPLYVYDVYVICSALNISTTEEKLKFFYPERPKSGTKGGTRKGARST